MTTRAETKAARKAAGLTTPTPGYSGYSLRRPGRKTGPAADAGADVISRHRTARAALVALRSQPRDEGGGYSADFIWDEKKQVRVSKYQADTGRSRP